MFLPQNLHDFIDNPMGKGSTVIMNRAQVREFLDIRYNNLIRKFGDFKYKIYEYNDSYYFHFIIPSETERRNTYDVVIQFINSDLPNENFSGDKHVRRYYIRLFSNCPSFTFTYAYVSSEYDKMIDILQNKYRDENLTSAPMTRNPGEILSYEKSTYFAAKFIADHRMMMEKFFINKNASKDIKSLIKDVRDTDTIFKEIAKEENRLKREGGNKGYTKLRKKTIKGSIFTTSTIKTAGVNKNSSEKQKIKTERKAENSISPKAKIPPKAKITPKSKIKPTTRSTKKK